MNIYKLELTEKEWNDFTQKDFVFLKDSEVAKDDYVLFYRLENFKLVQIREVIEYECLKDGYKMYVVNKI